jgi:branched-chain amino acid transport system ATP-binding protein
MSTTSSERTSGDDLVPVRPGEQLENFFEPGDGRAAREAAVDPPGLLQRFFRDFRAFGQLRRTPYGLTPVLIFALIGFFQQIDNAAFSFATPEFIRNGVKVSSIIGVIQVIGLISLFASLAVGWWADRHRRIPLFAMGTFLAGIAGMGTWMRQSTGGLGTARSIDEASNAAADVPSFSLLADYYPLEARGRTFAFLATLSRAGTLIAIPASAALIIAFGLRTTFVITGVPIAVMGVVALLRLREPVRGYFERSSAGVRDDVARTEDDPQSFGEGWRTVFAVRTIRRLFVANIFSSFVAGGVGLYTNIWFIEHYGLDVKERAFLAFPGVVVGLIAGVYGGGLVDRLSVRNPGRVLTIYGVFPIISAVGFLGYALQPPLFLLVFFGIIVSAGSALIGPAVGAIYSQVIPPSVRTQGLQMTGLAVIPGYLFGFAFVGLIRNEYGVQTMLLVAVPFYIVTGILSASAGGFFDIDRRTAIAASIAAEDWRQAKESGKAKLLVGRDIDVEYDGVQVLFGVDFEVEEGEILALLGTNGAGKSTLLRAISGTQEASAGAIVFDGRDITHMPPHEIAGRNIVHMPGGRGVFPGLTVRDNLLLGNWLHADPAEVRTAMTEVFEIFPRLRERLDEPAGALSGGEQQQLSLAQAFLMRPKLLMIDELSLGLSPVVVGQLLEIVKEINRRGVAIIVVEQSVNVALNLAHRALFMEKGEVRFNGPTSGLLERPDILRAVYVKGTGALTAGGPGSAQRATQDRRTMELATARPILEVSNLVKRFGGITAVDDLSFSVRENEVLGIIGPNGSGKTTMFDIVSGYQTADAGHVRYEGVDITDLSADERSRRRLIRRFQDARLFPSLTVFETLLVSLEQRLEVKNTMLNAFGAPRARRAERRLHARAERLIELLELGSYRDKFTRELSTGLRRIVDLACVLAAEPRVLLLDEPSSGIAQAEAEGLAPLLRRVQFETGCTILIIEHDMPLISAVSDELIALDRGQLVVRGTPDEVLNDDRVVSSYLGGSEAAIQRSGSLRS